MTNNNNNSAKTVRNFPADNIPENKRLEDSYGISVAKAIHSRSFLAGSGSNNIYDKIIENRLYASGRQSIDQYKTRLDPDVDKGNNTTLLNIDWSITSPLPKLVDVVIGGMINQDYKIQVNAVDRLSNVIRSKKRDDLFGKLVRDAKLKELEAAAGIPLVKNDGFEPKDKEDIEMYMEMEYKVPVEIASEEIIDWELYQNDYDKIKKRVLRDGVENNKMCVRTYFDSNNKIRLRYVDISRYIESVSDDPYSDESDYQAEVVYYSIREIRKISHGCLTEEDLFCIAQKFSGQLGNQVWSFGQRYSDSGMFNSQKYDFDDFRVMCLDFVYYTIENNVREKKENKYRGYYLNKKSSGYKPSPRSKYKSEIIEKEIEVSYEGLWVVGYDDKMVTYRKTKNLLRQVENGKISPKVKRSYLFVEPNRMDGISTSIVDLCKPIIDELQLVTLKMRHMLAEVAPPGAMIDIEAINNISINKNKISASDIIKMFKQKGILMYRGMDENGDPTRGTPIQEMINGVQNGLMPLQQQYAFLMERLREVTGINKARDASEPDKKALVGVQKLSLLSSNNATRELFDSYLDGIFRRVGDNVSIMANYKIQYADGLEYYSNIIGKFNAELLKLTTEEYSKAELGCKVEALPTEMDVDILNQDIAISLQAGEIDLEDAMNVRRIMNIKKAERYLIYKRKKRKEAAMQEMAQREQITMQREQGAAMAAAEKAKIIEMAKAEAKMMIQKQETELKMQYNDHESMNDIKKIDREYMWKQRLIEEAQDEGEEEGGTDDGAGTASTPLDTNNSNISDSNTKEDDMPRIFENPAGAATRNDI